MDSAKKRVLIVEDDEFLVKAYQYILEKENVDIAVARDGREAVALLPTDPPDLVLLDLMLPVMNGFEVLSAMRENDKWKWVPVMIITNLGQAQDRERGKELGAVEYMVKADSNIDDIVAAVKRYLYATK